MESTELSHDLETQDVFDSDKELIDLYVKFNYEDPNAQKQRRSHIHPSIMDNQDHVLKISDAAYQHWCRLQAMLGLRDDTAVAVFLLECYETSLSKKVPVLQCSYCKRTLSCLSCVSSSSSSQYSSSPGNTFLPQEHLVSQNYQHQANSAFGWGNELEPIEKKLYFGSQISSKDDFQANLNQVCLADSESAVQAVHRQQNETASQKVIVHTKEVTGLAAEEIGTCATSDNKIVVKVESASSNGDSCTPTHGSLEFCEESCQSSETEDMPDTDESETGSVNHADTGPVLKSKATRAMENILAKSCKMTFQRQIDGSCSLPAVSVGLPCSQERFASKIGVQASKTFECRVCWKVFFNSSEHHIHMRTHTGEKRICKECGATFDSTGHLTRHMRKHSGLRPFVCQECFATFADSSTLKKHMLTHATNKIFKCEICLIDFSRSDSLKVHMRAHTGEKPFACRTCDAAFSTSSHLKLHLRKHSGAKPYLCQMCGKAFADSSSMRRHTVNQACSKTSQ